MIKEMLLHKETTMNWGRVAAAVLIFVVGPAAAVEGWAAQTQTAESSMGKVDAFVRAEMARENVPGVAIGIVRKGEAIAVKGYGYANVELGVPVSGATIFQSGSVGKQFTATAVMLLVEDGKIGLDDSITKYFTDAPASWRPITVRNLLTHTSGLPNYEAQGENSSGGPGALDYRHDYTEEELTRVAYRLSPDFAPGTRWSYSNTGYVLLGILIHKVSGQFYGDVLRDRVFAPLGMSTARVITEYDIVPNRSAGYRLEAGEIKNQEWISPVFNTTADGSLYLTMNDFIACDRGLRAHAILKPQSWSQINTPVALKSGKTFPYGFGWEVSESNGKPWYHHGGAWQGFKTYISRYLADDLTIMVLTNLADAVPQRFVDGIADILDPKLAKIEPTAPISDSDPAVADHARMLLKKASETEISPQDLPDVVRGEIAGVGKYYTSLLQPLGRLQRLDLLDRRDLGDDRVSTYAAVFAGGTVRTEIGLTADGRVSRFLIQPE